MDEGLPVASKRLVLGESLEEERVTAHALSFVRELKQTHR